MQLIENKIDIYLYIFEAQVKQCLEVNKGSFTQVKQYLEVKKGSFTGLDLKNRMVWINVFIFYLKKWEQNYNEAIRKKEN